MQLLLSPAKLIDFSNPLEEVERTTPLFLNKAKQLVEYSCSLSIQEIASLLKINVKMAHDVYGYLHSFHLPEAPQRCAAFAFSGIAYKGLHIHDFTHEELMFAQQHLTILSGLYGMLRPLDVIKPHRLDVGTRLSMTRENIPKKRNLSTTFPHSNYLYGFWQESINNYLSQRLEEDDNTIVNLSSQEYYKLIVPQLLPKNLKVIDIYFKEQKAEGLKQVVVHTKKARGTIARFIIKNKITDIEDIKSFEEEGYFYYPSESTSTEIVFVR